MTTSILRISVYILSGLTVCLTIARSTEQKEIICVTHKLSSQIYSHGNHGIVMEFRNHVFPDLEKYWKNNTTFFWKSHGFLKGILLIVLIQIFFVKYSYELLIIYRL